MTTSRCLARGGVSSKLISPSGRIPDPGVYKRDCGWQLLGALMAAEDEDASECPTPASSFATSSQWFLFPFRTNVSVESLLYPQAPSRKRRACSRVENYYPLGARCQKRFGQRRRNHPDSSWRPTSGLKTTSFPHIAFSLPPPDRYYAGKFPSHWNTTRMYVDGALIMPHRHRDNFCQMEYSLLSIPLLCTHDVCTWNFVRNEFRGCFPLNSSF